MKKDKLKPNCIPVVSFGKSLYKILRNSGKLNEWIKLKNEISEKEGRHCWICEAIDGKNGELHLHEFWKYNRKTGIQTLTAVHHVCYLCHSIIHIGFTMKPDGQQEMQKHGYTMHDLIRHYCLVNKIYGEVDFRFVIWLHGKEIAKRDFVLKKGIMERRNWKVDFGVYSQLAEIEN